MQSLPRLAALALSLAASFGALAQTIPSVPSFPNEQRDLANAHLNNARILAGGDQAPAFLRRCIMAQAYSMYSNSAEDAYLMEPIKIFDNLFFVGSGAVNAWALKTSIGLVLIDSMNNAAEGESIVAEGLRRLGLSPADIKYLIITHEHGDHFGGAKYLQATYGAKVIASAPAWAGMTGTNAPTRDITVADGETLTLGDTWINFTATPGHTNGATSLIFPVYDLGARRTAAMYGGFGIPGNATTKMQQIDSLAKFALVSEAAGVDTLLANHQTQDLGLFNHELLRYRRPAVAVPASPSDMLDPHPYVVGAEQWQRFLKVQSTCVRASAARSNQVLPR
jgi:metallo-beta-lactamase class B